MVSEWDVARQRNRKMAFQGTAQEGQRPAVHPIYTGVE
jgi:hypothetical protein